MAYTRNRFTRYFMKAIELHTHGCLDLEHIYRKPLSMDMSMIRERMDALGVDLATLNRRYCEIRQQKGDEKAIPVNRRNMIAKAISDDGNPTLETFIDLITALDGEILIEWKDTRLQRLSSDNHQVS